MKLRNSIVLNKNSDARLAPAPAIQKQSHAPSKPVKNVLTTLFQTKVDMTRNISRLHAGHNTKEQAAVLTQATSFMNLGNTSYDAAMQVVAAKRPAPVPVGQPGKDLENDLQVQPAPKRSNLPRFTPTGR